MPFLNNSNTFVYTATTLHHNLIFPRPVIVKSHIFIHYKTIVIVLVRNN